MGAQTKIMAAVSILVLLVGGLSIPQAQAQSDTTYENLAWTPAATNVDDTGASGQAAKVVVNSVGTVPATNATVTNVRVHARGIDCNGLANLRITVNGVFTDQIVTPTYADYNMAVNAPANAVITVALTNAFSEYAWFWWVCDRALLVDNVTVTSGTPPTTTTPTTTTTTPTTTSAPPPPPPPGIPAGSEYAAMGDSYSSGEGANQVPGGAPDPNMVTGNCQRSTKAAQILLTAQYGWSLLNLACAGSTTANVLNTTGWEQPQMNLVTANTKLVTMTIGGNDVQLLQLMMNCMITTFYGDCIPTNNTGYAPTPAQQIAPVDAALAALQPKIEAVVDALVAKAPGVTIRMAGYPWVLPPPGQPVGACTWLSPGEQTTFDTRLHQLNNTIQAGTVAAAARHPGNDIAYVDPMGPGSPFVVTDNGCSSSPTRYLNAATGDAAAWHPNILGQANYRTLYANSLGLS